jgi:hypothetical protein
VLRAELDKQAGARLHESASPGCEILSLGAVGRGASEEVGPQGDRSTAGAANRIARCTRDAPRTFSLVNRGVQHKLGGT